MANSKEKPSTSMISTTKLEKKTLKNSLKESPKSSRRPSRTSSRRNQSKNNSKVDDFLNDSPNYICSATAILAHVVQLQNGIEMSTKLNREM